VTGKTDKRNPGCHLRCNIQLPSRQNFCLHTCPNIQARIADPGLFNIRKKGVEIVGRVFSDVFGKNQHLKGMINRPLTVVIHCTLSVGIAGMQVKKAFLV
jgi:hypothetical protein